MLHHSGAASPLRPSGSCSTDFPTKRILRSCTALQLHQGAPGYLASKPSSRIESSSLAPAVPQQPVLRHRSRTSACSTTLTLSASHSPLFSLSPTRSTRLVLTQLQVVVFRSFCRSLRSRRAGLGVNARVKGIRGPRTELDERRGEVVCSTCS